MDAIGLKRSGDGEGSHELQRTLLELLNAMDGFSSDSRIKVIAATNRPDILDPALLRSGRFDRKVELPNPNEEARVKILQIHSKKLVLNRESESVRWVRTRHQLRGNRAMHRGLLGSHAACGVCGGGHAGAATRSVCH